MAVMLQLKYYVLLSPLYSSLHYISKHIYYQPLSESSFQVDTVETLTMSSVEIL
jgi:hypothetical protein